MEALNKDDEEAVQALLNDAHTFEEGHKHSNNADALMAMAVNEQRTTNVHLKRIAIALEKLAQRAGP